MTGGTRSAVNQSKGLKSSFYKDNVRKDKAWHLIAVVLGVEGEYIRFRIIA